MDYGFIDGVITCAICVWVLATGYSNKESVEKNKFIELFKSSKFVRYLFWFVLIFGVLNIIKSILINIGVFT
jgi:hypothetical protein